MLGFYTPVLILQALCLYHAYQKRAEQRWYWFILLFPVIGCLLYIIHHFGSRTTLETVAEGVKGVVNTNYKVEQLEKQLRHADSVTNRIGLADAYLELGRCDDAIDLYVQCLAGFMAEDPVLRMKLVQAYYLRGNYEQVIAYGDLLGTEKSFQQAEERIAYAWAFFHIGRNEKAHTIFSEMDRSFTNYTHRLEFCRFLEKTASVETLKAKLQEILDEFETMKGNEKRMYKPVLNELRDIHYRVEKPKST